MATGAVAAPTAGGGAKPPQDRRFSRPEALWPATPRGVHQARADLLAVLTGWGLAGVVDDATLVLGELMTNALRHGRVGDRRIGTTFSRTPHGDGVVLEVHDAHDGVPVLKDADELAEHGRGLAIVDALTSGHWGVADREGPGKVVWAVCTGTPPPAP